MCMTQALVSGVGVRTPRLPKQVMMNIVSILARVFDVFVSTPVSTPCLLFHDVNAAHSFTASNTFTRLVSPLKFHKPITHVA